ncbi:MAG TPA: sigma-70 family RNA polymerase sigma factor [Gemmataceae bacterium]|jgi:RNA polymerase sigma-70 factor (ECF subfamily)|nr:sigma-70 family RNA polymerase sigma factor [Gemmataceae bacterium]
MADTDAELIRRWREGQEEAFALLVRRWEQPLARFLSRLANQPDQVADWLQETFLRLHRAGVRYQENGHFSTWLFQIALNVARDAARRHRPLQPLPELEPPSHSMPIMEQYERRELGERLAHAIAELPWPQREVLALRHDQGMSFEEMSRLLGVPASTLKSRFAAALARLRDQLRDEEED